MSNQEQEMKAREHDISDAGAEVVTEVVDAAGEEVKTGFKKIEGGVVTGYRKIEDGVVTGYKKIEEGVVEGFTGMVDKVSGVMLDEEGHLKTGKVGEVVVGAYKKVEDAFVSTFIAKDGETVEEAKARLTAEQQAREAAQQEMIEKSLDASRNAGKRN